MIWLLTAALSGVTAHAEVLEDLLLLPSSMPVSRHFSLNPANDRFQGVDTSASGAKVARLAKLEQQGNGASYEAKSSEDHLGVAVMTDLGAGAGIGFSHQAMFRKISIHPLSMARAEKFEHMHETQSALKLVIELIEGLNAGMAMRYVFHDYRIIGNIQLSERQVTGYRAAFVGYGAGLGYDSGRYGLGYVYYPPLRSKTTIMSEEFIIVERGQIVVDAYATLNPHIKCALLLKRWINELDDRAAGTTAEDNQTVIALLGLDPDQYLLQRQLAMVAVDFEMTSKSAIRVGVGREEAELNFSDFSPSLLSQGNVTKRATDPTLQYHRARALLKFSDAGLELSAGGGFFRRSYDYPEDLGGAKYEANGREWFASVSLQL